MTGSPLEYALLGLLKQKPQSGYDLRKMFATTPVRHFSDSPGSIYPALRRLQSRQWLASGAEHGNRRKRQVFRVTALGRRALQEWLLHTPTREDMIWRVDELLLRFAFFDGNVERGVTLQFLRQFERELQAYIRELREYQIKFEPEMKSTTGALAFSSGVEGYEARLAWVHRAQKELAEIMI